MKHLQGSQGFTKHLLQFSLSLGVPRAPWDTVTTSAQCAWLSVPPWAQPMQRAVPATGKCPLAGAEDAQGPPPCLSIGFIPRDLSRKQFCHCGFLALNLSWGLLRHREVPEGPF